MGDLLTQGRVAYALSLTGTLSALIASHARLAGGSSVMCTRGSASLIAASSILDKWQPCKHSVRTLGSASAMFITCAQNDERIGACTQQADARLPLVGRHFE